MDDSNSVTTRLLTLLNVSAVKAGKRKQAFEVDFVPAEKLNKRKSVQISAVHVETVTLEASPAPIVDIEINAERQEEVIDDVEPYSSPDSYEKHFGTTPVDLTDVSRDAVERRSWVHSREVNGKLGPVILSLPEGSTRRHSPDISVVEKLKTPFQARQGKLHRDQIELQNELISALSTHQDLYLAAIPWESQQSVKEATTLHVLNHITKKRRRVLKNNERIAHSLKLNPDAPPPEDVQDQGFTRPSVLFLLPFRSSALRWLDALISHTPSPSFQIENHSRFLSEYGLPPGAIDKLATAEPGTYPRDHVETFKGNVDDNFRLGIKMTRKSVKLFAEFYGCDIIIASPLGLRMSIEKEKSADFLSSIEILVVDQMDALLMQNWDHVQFVFSNLNKLPKESHNTDFSRIKPWYLDGHSAYLRQSILFTAYETPETRFLFNNTLKNVTGKLRSEKRYSAIQVPEGIDQHFIPFDCTSPKDEADKRFLHFTTQLLPTILKSAVQSANTAVFIPSSFDFIRVHNYFKKHAGVTFTILSEYSSNQDISRARQSFFEGKKSFLLISERFHFYRRYKIRGIRNLIFYGAPDHPQFYTELLSYPFLDQGVEGSDITSRVLYSKYDWMKLSRIVGTEGAVGLIKN